MKVSTSIWRQVIRCHHQSELTIESHEIFAELNSRDLHLEHMVPKMRAPLTPLEKLFLHEGGSAHDGILSLFCRSVEVDEDQEFFRLTCP